MFYNAYIILHNGTEREVNNVRAVHRLDDEYTIVTDFDGHTLTYKTADIIRIELMNPAVKQS